MFHRDSDIAMIEDVLRLATVQPWRGQSPGGSGPEVRGPEGKAKGQGVHIDPRAWGG